MATEAQPAPSREPSPWSRTYPPLVFLVVAVLIAGFVLPSALNLPQSNPSTVLEYAPVPPEDDDLPNPPQGNLSSLGLGGSGTLSEGGLATPPPPPDPDIAGSGTTPTRKNCVGDPPRQTEDPMSPPCVSFFDGDNFGATWPGVTEGEIRVLIYLDVGCPNFECSRNAGTYYDLDEAPLPPCPKTWPSGNPNNHDCDYIWVRISRGLNHFFNDRFQTYNRRVHYHAYFTNASSPEERRSDAAEHKKELDPFAVIDYATYNGHNEAYADAAAARGILVFSSRSALNNAFFVKNAPNAWGFWPDVERWAPQFVSYVCNTVVGHRVSHAGNPRGTGPYIGREREYGIYYTTDPGEPGLQAFAKKVKDGISECGISDPVEGTFANSGFAVDNSDAGEAQTQALTRFQGGPGDGDDVTTILWLGGMEGKFTQAADQVKYYPEIILAGDLENDNNEAGRLQAQNVWQNVRGTQFQLRIDDPANSFGARAYRAGSPQAPAEDARFAEEMYRDHFMLFQAIQVAGPRLTPYAVDQGFHAIPTHESTSPHIASCFFQPDDYTCVKDSMEIWWDPDGESPAAPQRGCYRMVSAGDRHVANDWAPEENAFGDPAKAPCTGFESRFQINP